MENLKMGYENELSGHGSEGCCSGYNKDYDHEESCGCEACTVVEESRYIQKWYEDCPPDDDGYCLEFCSTVEDYETFVINGAIEEMIGVIEDNVTDVSNPENCGIHIHVDLQHYTPLSMYNAMKFMNTRENNDIIYSICDRSDGDHHWIRSKEIGSFHLNTSFMSAYSLAGSSRCLRNGEYNTLEYRTFLASTDVDTIKRYFQFVHAMTIFSRPMTFENTAEAFFNFVTESEDYPILKTFLERENVCVSQ